MSEERAASVRTTQAEADVRIVDAWAKKHGCEAVFDGECGFGRPCVGVQGIAGKWLDYDPLAFPDYDRLHPDDPPFPSVPGAYHKHDCLAVLVDGDDYALAASRLREWVEKIDALDPFVEEFATGATGIQAMFTGTRSKCVRIRKSPTPASAADRGEGEK